MGGELASFLRSSFYLFMLFQLVFLTSGCSDMAASSSSSLNSEGSSEGVNENLGSSVFAEQPSSKVSDLMSSVELNILVDESQVSGYSIQWQFQKDQTEDFTDLVGETSAKLIIDSFSAKNEGNYRVVLISQGKTYLSEVASLRAKTGVMSCDVNDLKLQWPMQGERNVDWGIINYFDSDQATANKEDYSGAKGEKAHTYDQHKGVDIGIYSLYFMSLNIPVYASADGVVEFVHDGEFDENLENSSREANKVYIRSANGFLTSYLHFMKNSIMVEVGDEVSAGDLLGFVGSSGNSGSPHLHIETKNCEGVSIDHMEHGMFIDPPKLWGDTSLYTRTFRLNDPFTSSIDTKAVKAPSIGSSNSGQTVYYSLVFFDVVHGDKYEMRFFKPNGDLGFVIDREVDIPESTRWPRITYWGSFTLNTKGDWEIRYRINGKKVKEENFKVK